MVNQNYLQMTKWILTSIVLSSLVLPQDLWAASSSASNKPFVLSENVDVDPGSGAAALSIPIEVPPGRGGIEPAVTLFYNSTAAIGLAGMGWNMEFGAIQRSTRKGIPQYNNTDTFVLVQSGSQQELVDISGNGTEFRPETEGSFSKITFNGTTWTVLDKRGVKYYFGQALDSQVYDPANTARVYKWMLNRVEDLLGNYMTFTYGRYDNNLFATSIDYTGNTTANIPTHAKVKINYEGRTVNSDIVMTYAWGFQSGISQRIKNVETYIGTALQRRYTLNYIAEPQLSRSLLRSVSVYGDDGVSTLPATVMSYSDSTVNFNAPLNLANVPNLDLDSNALNVRLIDMNADGKVDIVYGQAGGNWQIYLNQSSGTNVSFAAPVLATNAPTYGANDADVRLVDLNGDGLMDVVYGRGAPYKIWMNNRVNGFNAPVATTNSPSNYLSDQNLVQFVDMNNDGKQDIVRTPATAGGVWEVYLNTTGSDFGPATTIANYPDKGTNNATVQWGDFNGDGLSDIIIGELPNYRIWINNGANGFKSPVTATTSFPFALNDRHMQMADMNGDGLTDIVRTNDEGTIQYYTYFNNGKLDFNAPLSAITIPSAGFTNVNVRLVDMNEDGKADVLIGAPTQTDASYKLWLNDGYANFKSPIALSNYPNTNLDGRNLVIADMNGDGRMDLVHGPTGAWQAWLNKPDSRCAKPATLIDMDNSFGMHLEIQYQHLPIINMGGSGYKTAVSPFLMTSVKTISKRATLQGQVYTAKYNYSGGLWSTKEREFRGYKTVKTIDPDGNYAISEFLQDDIYRGRPSWQASYDAAGNLYNKSVNTWASQTLYTGVVFPFIKRVDNYVYDGNASGRRTAQEFFYDGAPQYGNVTKTISYGEVDLSTGSDIGTDKTTSEVSYHNNTANWLLGLPKLTTLKDNADTVIAKTWFYYDNVEDQTTLPVKGLLSKKIDWAGDAVGTVHPFVTYSYNSIGQLLTTSDNTGSTTSISYDLAYKIFPLTTTNALNHIVTNEYYGINGVPLSNADGTHGLWGQMKSTTDPNNQKGIKIYDTFGRVSKTVGPNDTIALPTGTVDYIYGANEMKVVTKSRIQSGNSAVMSRVDFYDGIGRPVQSKTKSEYPNKSVVTGQVEYNLRGLPIKKYSSFFTTVALTDRNALDTTQPYATLSYDAMGRMIKSTNPDGSYSNVTYDDWTTTTYDENGHMQKSFADAFGRLIKKEEYLGADGRNANYPVKAFTLYATTLYTYDAKGNLIKTQDTKGNITTIQYDTLGRKIAMTDPDMGTWTYGYDVLSNMIWQQDAKGQRINFSYDVINRLKQKTDLSVLTVDYTYDDPTKTNTKGRLTKASYGGGKTEFEYDNLGRELKSIKTIGTSAYQVNRTYDAIDRLVTLQYPDNGKVGYTYNDAGLVNSVFEVLPTTVMPPPTGTDGVYLASPFTQYRLNDNAADTVVYDNGTSRTNAAASVNTSNLSRTGKVNAGMFLNGTSQYVNLDSFLTKVRNDSKGTFTFWVKPEKGSSLLTFIGASSNGVSVEWDEFGQALVFYAGTSAGWVSGYTPTNTLLLGAWSHVAVVQDGVNLKVYINGQEQPLSYWNQSNKGAWFSASAATTINFGRMGAVNNTATATSNSGFFRGTMDDVRYYSNKALIPQEVWAIYNNYSGTEAENPVVTNAVPANITLVPHLASAFAQYKLNDNAGNTTVLDESVNYNDGVANTNTTVISTAGKINQAFNFTGTQSVNLDNLLTDIKTDAVGTISLWVKPVNDTGAFLSFSGTGGYFSIDWYKSNQSANFAISGAGTPISCTTQTGSLPANTYSHLVIVQNGTQFKIYINGVQQTITSWYNSNPGAWFSFLTGALTNNRLGSTVWQGNEYFFTGGVDDLRYYKKALSQPEVLALYNNGSGTEDANPAIGTEPVSLPPLESSTVPATAGQVYVKNVDYTAQGQIAKLEYGNGVITTYTYDPKNFRLNNLKTVNTSGTVIQNFTYTYDGVGDIMSITDSANTATQTFKYDELNRLTQATGTMYGTKTYTYDEIGNILTKDGITYTYSKVGAGPHAVTSLSDGTTITYDLNGNMIRKSMPGTVMEYFFDKENRLIEVKKNTSTVAQFLYDGDGGRVQKTSYVSTVNTVSGGVSFGTLSTTQTITTTPVTTKYVGEMYEESGPSTGSGSKSIYFGSQKVAMVDTNNSSPIFLHGDHLGSTNVTTNASGVVQELIEYEPFGKIQKHSGANGNTRLAKQQFTGKKLDDETGLYFFNARYYDPQLGKFITPDTIVQAPSNPQTLNRYTYCNNNPINLVDPSGHKWSWKKFWHAAVGALVGIVATGLLGPGGAFAFFSTTWGAAAFGGALGGAISGGLDGGWKGALISGALGGVLGGIGGWASGFKNTFAKDLILGGMAAGGIGYTAATGSWDSFAGGVVGAAIGSQIPTKAAQKSNYEHLSLPNDSRSEMLMDALKNVRNADAQSTVAAGASVQCYSGVIETLNGGLDKALSAGGVALSGIEAYFKSAAEHFSQVSKELSLDLSKHIKFYSKFSRISFGFGLAAEAIGYLEIGGKFLTGQINWQQASNGFSAHTAGIAGRVGVGIVGAGIGFSKGGIYGAAAGAVVIGGSGGLVISHFEDAYLQSIGVK